MEIEAQPVVELTPAEQVAADEAAASERRKLVIDFYKTVRALDNKAVEVISRTPVAKEALEQMSHALNTLIAHARMIAFEEGSITGKELRE